MPHFRSVLNSRSGTFLLERELLEGRTSSPSPCVQHLAPAWPLAPVTDMWGVEGTHHGWRLYQSREAQGTPPVAGAPLKVLYTYSSHRILTTAPQNTHSYFSWFTDEELEAKRVQVTVRVLQLLNGTARI